MTDTPQPTVGTADLGLLTSLLSRIPFLLCLIFSLSCRGANRTRALLTRSRMRRRSHRRLAPRFYHSMHGWSILARMTGVFADSRYRPPVAETHAVHRLLRAASGSATRSRSI